MRTEALFTRHCAACHGEHGGADGPLAELLAPRPRDFAQASFLLVSTDNGVPTDGDLMRTLERGMPGTTMPSFSWLPEADRRLLAQHVRQLAIEGRVESRRKSAEAAGQAFDAEHARSMAVQAMTPGAESAVREPVAATETVVARGRELFTARCAACHGTDGKGWPAAPRWRERPEFTWPADLTAGVLKGGTGHRDLSWRLAAGMPAAGMPPSGLSTEDAAAVVAFVQSLLPPGADELVQRRERVVAVRVNGQLPDTPDDPRWQATRLVLAPLQAHARAIDAVSVAFLHNGQEIAALLRWKDPTRDDVPINVFPDAVALQFADDQDPPVIAMGTPRQPVHIWHWQAFRPHEIAGDLDALAPRPDGSRADVPLQRRPAAFAAPSAVAAVGHGRGVASGSPVRDAAAELAAQARWRDDTWTLILRRPLAPGPHDDVRLELGRSLHFACAVWNGAAGDAGVRKSISVWQRLEMAP